MIVACEACSTEFQLDDAKVPAKGIRVRCSRCKHTFLVRPEGAEPPERPAATPHPEGAEEGADWQFNHDPPADAGGGADTSQSVRSAIDQMLDSAPALEKDTGGTDAVQAAVANLLGGGGSSAEPQDGGEEAGGADEDGDGADDDSDDERQEGLFAAPDSEIGGSVEADAGLASPEDDALPEPDIPLEGDGPGLAEEETGAPQQAIGGVALAKVAVKSVVEAAPRRKVNVASELSFLSLWAGHLANGIGWLATLGLVAATAWRVVPSHEVAVAPVPTSQRVSGIQAEAVEGRWIENLRGSLYVISGTLRRADASAGDGVRLGVRLLDASGEALEGELAAVGPAIPSSALRESDPRQLRTSLAQGALEWAATPLGAGERRRFHAVFERPPAEAALFRLEPMESGSEGAAARPDLAAGMAAPSPAAPAG